MALAIPKNLPSLRRAMGMFSHYSRWISNFSEKLHPLTKVTHYPLTKEQIEASLCRKQEIAKSSLVAIDSSLPLEIETDALEHAIAASLTQNGRPVAFFSRTLTSRRLKRRRTLLEKRFENGDTYYLESILSWSPIKNQSCSCSILKDKKWEDHKMEIGTCLFQLWYSISFKKTECIRWRPIPDLLFYYYGRQVTQLARRFMSSRSNPNATFCQKQKYAVLRRKCKSSSPGVPGLFWNEA